MPVGLDDSLEDERDLDQMMADRSAAEIGLDTMEGVASREKLPHHHNDQGVLLGACLYGEKSASSLADGIKNQGEGNEKIPKDVQSSSSSSPSGHHERKPLRPLNYFDWCGGVMGKYVVGELKPPSLVMASTYGSGKHP
ncbi:unnamed protein product [Lactuca saligna]|uniref:Uncharacterized protein n=1 Tax=Lactuca saligna TaxID=75948 RepID=A0AA35ZSF2_LACSI|nr:unnamed protein product [Lactuca saligna]